jgi:hypothetical protein
MTTPNWKTEFPDFPEADMPALPEGWEDISWRNDACPNFVNYKLGVALFVDFAEPEKREIPEYPRFLAYPVYEDGTPASDQPAIAESEDFDTVMKIISKYGEKK